ncbi:kinase-like domain-containing protein [Xylariaceae sp. FL1651]|nr:kinase-like domain-containing protein [Xylariaceae sp. FL1651]
MAQPQLLQVVSLADSDDEQARVLATELRNYFARSKIWQYERALGNGAYGVAVLLRQPDHVKGRGKRVVLKRALRNGAAELRHEILVLKMLRGSSHSAQMLACCEDLAAFAIPGRSIFGLTSQISTLLSRVKRLFYSPPNLQTVFRTLRELEGPAILQEYVENGTLTDLQERMKVKDIHLPNRVLWRFYLCLVRACVGLAYPPHRPEGSTPVLETIPTDGTPPGDLLHGDIAGRNIMIGDGFQELFEHWLTPELKMIDFGNARESENRGEGPRENIYRVSIELLRLINRGPVQTRAPRYVSVFNGIETAATCILPVNGVPTFPKLCPVLRDLLVEALSTNKANRPTLQQMLQRTEQAVHKIPSPFLELPLPQVQDILQQLIYDV